MKKTAALNHSFTCLIRGRKRLLSLSLMMLISLFTSTVFAQTESIRGRLTDEKGVPVPFANVALLKQAGNVLTASTLADSTGAFSITAPAAGTYFLRITVIGYEDKKTDVFELTGSRDLGTISLKTDAKTLKDVTVTALRPTITQLADRMVVSVEGTAMAAGSTAYSVLQRAPGVFVDPEGNIQLNGRSGVTVMLNNKLTYLSARDLRTLLEGMSAENIKNIEIITNPSAKYDAEGTSGILNINLKKNTAHGMTGSVYAGYTYNFKQHGYSTGGNIYYRTGRWNSFANVDMVRRVGGREATFTRVFYGNNKTTYFDQYATGNFVGEGPPSIRIGTEFNPNDRNTFAFMTSYFRNTANQDFLTETYIGSQPKDPAQFIDADNVSRNTYRNNTFNLHYTGKLDTSGTSISADLDYVKITNRGDANLVNSFTNLITEETTKDVLYTNTPNSFDIYSAKIDFTTPLKKGQKLDIGAKASRVVTDNDFGFYFANGPLVIDPTRTNHFNYRENIYAAYANWNGKLSAKWSVQAGLRGEQTQSTGESFTTGDVNRRSYFNLFPSVFVQQKVSGNYGVNYSYSRRLTRPNYGALNSFRAYRDPYTWYEGNPQLRPQYTNSFSIAQVIKKLYTVTLSYNQSKDAMAEIPILNVEDTVTVYTTGNVNDGHSVGMSAVAPFKITKKWDTQNTMVVNYSKFSMNSNNGLLENDQLFFMFQSNHTIQLPHSLRAELNLLYRGPAASGLYHMAPMHRVDIAFKKSFLNKKLDLTLNVNDIFKGFRYNWTTDINGNVNEFDQYFRIRTVGATLRYNFSKGLKVDMKRKNSTVEEVNRT